MERVNQYLKDRIESFDDYYPCMQKWECSLIHVHNWIQFFVSMYNDTIANNKYRVWVRGGEYYLNLTGPTTIIEIKNYFKFVKKIRKVNCLTIWLKED